MFFTVMKEKLLSLHLLLFKRKKERNVEENQLRIFRLDFGKQKGTFLIM